MVNMTSAVRSWGYRELFFSQILRYTNHWTDGVCGGGGSSSLGYEGYHFFKCVHILTIFRKTSIFNERLKNFVLFLTQLPMDVFQDQVRLREGRFAGDAPVPDWRRARGHRPIRVQHSRARHRGRRHHTLHHTRWIFFFFCLSRLQSHAS